MLAVSLIARSTAARRRRASELLWQEKLLAKNICDVDVSWPNSALSLDGFVKDRSN